MKEFIKKHYLLVPNILFPVLIVLTFVNKIVFEHGLLISYVFYIIFVINIVVTICFSAFIIAMNITAFIAVKKDKGIAIVSALLGGILGAFISTRTANKNYRYKKTVNLLFNISAWIFIWALASIEAYGYYGYP